MYQLGSDDISLIMEHVSGAVAIDMSGTIVYINEKYARRFDTQKEEALGIKIRTIFPQTLMMEGLRKDKPEIVFYNNATGISICIQTPLYKDGEKVGLLEYDAVRGSELQNDFTDSYILFLEEEISHLKNEIRNLHETKYSIDNISGISPLVVKLKDEILSAAKSNYSVLIYGESGTGKELSANAIHDLSGRHAKNFVRFNIADATQGEEEKELFGFEEIIGIGEIKNVKKGKFEIAQQGTLFIDEIDKIPYALQHKLYQALQKGEICRVGGTKTIPIDVKIIAATSQNLAELVKEGRFDENLLKKLNTIKIHTPELRNRPEDLPYLTEHIIAELNPILGTHVQSVGQIVLREFEQYSWPGNVRELYNVIERAMLNARKGVLELEDFEFKYGIFGAKSYTIYDSDVDYNLIEEAKRKAERDMITAALKKFNNNKTKTAAYLEIARPLLYQKMDRLGIKR